MTPATNEASFSASVIERPLRIGRTDCPSPKLRIGGPVEQKPARRTGRPFLARRHTHSFKGWL